MNITYNIESLDISNNIKSLDISNNIESLDISNNNLNILNNHIRKIDTLCFSGGGIKGISFIGALEELIENEIIELSNIKKIVGTSVGSMIGFILSLGYDIDEIKEFILKFDFSKINSKIDVNIFLEKLGANNGEKIIFILKKMLYAKFNVDEMTFEELYNLTQKDLIIIGTNYTKGKEAIFSKDTTPTISIIKAIRISISIPLVFTPVEHNEQYYIDGAFTNNFPICHCDIERTLGFYIKYSKENNNLNNVFDYILTFLAITTDTISEKDITNNKNIIKIDSTNSGIINFNLTIEMKTNLIELGKKSVKEFLNN